MNITAGSAPAIRRKALQDAELAAAHDADKLTGKARSDIERTALDYEAVSNALGGPGAKEDKRKRHYGVRLTKPVCSCNRPRHAPAWPRNHMTSRSWSSSSCFGLRIADAYLHRCWRRKSGRAVGNA